MSPIHSPCALFASHNNGDSQPCPWLLCWYESFKCQLLHQMDFESSLIENVFLNNFVQNNMQFFCLVFVVKHWRYQILIIDCYEKKGLALGDCENVSSEIFYTTNLLAECGSMVLRCLFAAGSDHCTLQGSRWFSTCVHGLLLSNSKAGDEHNKRKLSTRSNWCNYFEQFLSFDYIESAFLIKQNFVTHKKINQRLYWLLFNIK